MTDRPTTLGELLDLAVDRHGTASMLKLSEIARANDQKINNATLSAMRKGTYSGSPERSTIDALAWLSGVTYEVARDAAGVAVGAPSFVAQVPVDADLLTPKQRAGVLAQLRELVDAQKEIGRLLQGDQARAAPSVDVALTVDGSLIVVEARSPEPDRAQLISILLASLVQLVQKDEIQSFPAPDPRPFGDRLPTEFNALDPTEERVMVELGWGLLSLRRQKSGSDTEVDTQVGDSSARVQLDVRGLRPRDVRVNEDTNLDDTGTR